eukprot:766962-Hanusia_phi.AAC.5
MLRCGGADRCVGRFDRSMASSHRGACRDSSPSCRGFLRSRWDAVCLFLALTCSCDQKPQPLATHHAKSALSRFAVKRTGLMPCCVVLSDVAVSSCCC